MRERDPRRLLRRRRQAAARVTLIEQPRSTAAPDGSVATKQVADVTLPREELDRIWSPEYLERLARTYWRFLTRISLGLLRIVYRPDSRQIALIGRPFVLLTFHAPEYDTEPNRGTVTWRIKRGLLVAPIGRGKGYLRISVERPAEARGDMVTTRVSSEVANFYPTIGGWGWFTRIGHFLYGITQLRIHVIITNAFLRSLARLDLAPSVVGALRQQAAAAAVAGDLERAVEAARAADEEAGTRAGADEPRGRAADEEAGTRAGADEPRGRAADEEAATGDGADEPRGRAADEEAATGDGADVSRAEGRTRWRRASARNRTPRIAKAKLREVSGERTLR